MPATIEVHSRKPGGERVTLITGHITGVYENTVHHVGDAPTSHATVTTTGHQWVETKESYTEVLRLIARTG